MGEVREILRAYKVAHKYREEWYNVKWRLVVVALSVLFICFVYWYLNSYKPYAYFIEEFGFLLSDRLFYWFMIGALFGIISVGLIFEGEFLLGLRNIAKEINQTEKALIERGKPPARKPSKRKR
ncbi:MAG: hypothetical protein V1835_06530 [Candidatus Micrarchaeota archaeon]